MFQCKNIPVDPHFNNIHPDVALLCTYIVEDLLTMDGIKRISKYATPFEFLQKEKNTVINFMLDYNVSESSTLFIKHNIDTKKFACLVCVLAHFRAVEINNIWEASGQK